MFIWTISDIAAVIIFIFFVMAAISAFIPARTGSRQSEPKAATRNECQKEAERNGREAPAWMIVLGVAIFLAICLLFAK